MHTSAGRGRGVVDALERDADETLLSALDHRDFDSMLAAVKLVAHLQEVRSFRRAKPFEAVWPQVVGQVRRRWPSRQCSELTGFRATVRHVSSHGRALAQARNAATRDSCVRSTGYLAASV